MNDGQQLLEKALKDVEVWKQRALEAAMLEAPQIQSKTKVKRTPQYRNIKRKYKDHMDRTSMFMQQLTQHISSLRESHSLFHPEVVGMLDQIESRVEAIHTKLGTIETHISEMQLENSFIK
eukprot:TRINITY_DN1038_c0_g1_i3.p1 TRINITY_DN1038_c0_g1~~TRINITY_DN1038_c0_g1_i3.p1  ORF type:complete len:121 (-),score=29.25 TRINITY_DN1038_c0_g1_i3:619-981(-)